MEPGRSLLKIIRTEPRHCPLSGRWWTGGGGRGVKDVYGPSCVSCGNRACLRLYFTSHGALRFLECRGATSVLEGCWAWVVYDGAPVGIRMKCSGLVVSHARVC